MTPHYHIRDLAHLSGVQAHTIRVWERRYNLLAPARTDTNIRMYTDDDLRVLLNVSVLCDHGMRISRVAQLSAEEIGREVERVTARENSQPHRLQQLVLAMVDLDETRLETYLTLAIQDLGMGRAMLEVVYPFLERIGVLWQVGTIQPAQEHLVTCLLRQKLVVAVDSLGPQRARPEAKRFVLYLPEREMHELALLYMQFVLRAAGHHITYLGQNLPTRDLGIVVAQVKPDYLLTVLTVVPEREAVQPYIQHLSEAYAAQQVLFYGTQVHYDDLTWPANTRRFTDMRDFAAWAEEINVEKKPFKPT